MFTTGLTSITFRGLSVEEIAGAARANGLRAIEWGSDVHVLPGDLARAAYVRDLTARSGLIVSSYGSYYRLGAEADPAAAFAPYIASAEALGAPIIRIWGGSKGSAQLSDAEFDALAAEGRTLAALAAEHGLTLSLECHPGTVTDEYAPALRYLRAVDHPAMRTYWQPNQNFSFEYNLESARALAPYTTNIHVFSWDATQGAFCRYPLAHFADRWHAYLNIFRAQPGDRALLLEFMHDDRVETLPETAAELNRWNA
mgnify:FL=1